MPTEEQNNVIDLGVLEDNPNPLELAQSPTEQELSDQLSQETLQATEGVADIDVGGFEDEIARLMGEAGQEGQFRSAVQQELGIPQEQQTLRDLSRKLTAQRLGLGSALNRAELEAIGTGETKQFFGGKEARIRRESAIDTNTTAAQMLGVQGNIEAAISLADRAVDAKFEPLKRELEVAQFNLGRADKYMSGAEKKLAAAKKQELDFQLDELENERTLEKDRTSGIFGVAERAQQNGAPSSLIQQITAAKTPEEALALAGGYGVSISDRLAQSKFAADQKKLQDDLNVSEAEAEGMVNQIEAARDLGKFTITGSRGKDLSVLDQIIAPNKVALKVGRGTGNIRQQSQDYISGVENILNTLTLNTFAEAKDKGMTFGAMSEGEWDILAATASRLSQRRLPNKSGTTIGYSGSEEGFKEDITEITEGFENAYRRAVGESFPEEYTIDESGNIVVPVEESNEEFFAK